VEAINSADFPVIKAIVFVGSVMYVFASLLTDICYALVDPRIKLR
jgi:peptide/nickel transport system permease protein